jgi:hypothetical protein
MVLGGLLLVDLAGRVPDLTAHYTDDAVLPRSARMAMEYPFCEPWWMSLHMLSGDWWWQLALFLLAAGAAAMLLFGYRTRLSLVVSWLLLLSLHGRFPLLTQGGDMLLRCMLVWSLFMPEMHRRPQDRGWAASMGTAAFIVQLVAMYLFTALLKTGPSWRQDFSAAYYALSIDHFTSPLGYALLRYPTLLQWLTLSSIVLEAVGPLLLFVPFRQTFFRTAVPLAFIGFHLGLAATMHLGTFPWICIAFWTVLLPPAMWDAGETLLRRLGLGRFMRERRVSGVNDEVQTRPLTASGAVAAVLLIYVVLLNVSRLQHPFAQVGPAPLSLLGKATGLDQYWNMFSPGPYQFGGWLRIEGETSDGRTVNLYAPDEPLPDIKPVNVSSAYPSQYWRRCLVTLYEFEQQPHLEGTLRYFARQWNRTHRHEARIVTARLVHMVESVPPPFAKSGERSVERRELCAIEISE